MAGSLAPQWFMQIFDDAGNVASGAKMFSYVSGTSTPFPIYADQACHVPLNSGGDDGPWTLNAAGRGEFWLMDGITYRLRIETADGDMLVDRSGIRGVGVAPGDGDTYKVKANEDDGTPGFLDEKLIDSDTVHWTVLPDDSGIQAVVQEGAGDTYKVKVNADDATPGFLENKLADTTDTQFSPTEDGSQLDNIVYQLTGLGTRLNRVKDAGFDFEVGPFPQASHAGGRGICFGRRFVAGVEVDTWAAQANNGKLYWTSNNDASRWKVVTEDTSIYSAYPSARIYYGWSCIQFVYVAGTHNCFCWVMGSGDLPQTIIFVEHKADSYNADGTFKTSALNSVTYGPTVGPYSAIDIMQVDTTGGIFIAGDDPKVGYTTDLANFQLAVTADANVGGLGFDGETTVQVIERDTGVIWRSSTLGSPGSFTKVATFYLDDVPVANFPMPQPGGSAAQWGSMFSMYGQWLSINFRYVAGGIGFIYSDDGVYWYSSKDEATPFYDANNDGLRWFATNAAPNSESPIFQLIVSVIPAHRRMSLEKGAVISGPTILREIPSATILGTDHRGRVVNAAPGITPSTPTEIHVLGVDVTGQITQYAQMARRDVLETFAEGIQDSTLGVGLPMFAGTAGRLSTESVANFRSRIGAVNKSGDTITGSLTVNGWIEADQGFRDASGITRISAGGAGTLTTLNTTGLADLASARVQSLTASQMVATDGSKNLVSWDAGTARANLGITRDWGYASGGVPVWIKVARMRITTQYGTASFSARATDIGVSGAGDYGIVDVVGRIRQNNPMSSPLDLVNLIVSRQGATEMTFGYVVEVDNSAEKVVSVYVALIGYRGAVASAIASTGDLSFLSGQPLLTSAPAGYIQATWAASTVGSIKATSQSGPGPRMVQAGTDGAQSASIPVPTAFAQTLLDDADQAAARATLGAQAALGYTPVNKAGDALLWGDITTNEILFRNDLISQRSGANDKNISIYDGVIHIGPYAAPGATSLGYKTIGALSAASFSHSFEALDFYSTAMSGSGIRPILTDNNGKIYADNAIAFLGAIGVKIRSFASIYASSPASAQSIPTGTTYTKVTPFNANLAGSQNSTPDQANDRIVVGRAGVYQVDFSRSYEVGTANTTWHVAVFVNGIAAPQTVQEIKTATASQVNYAALAVQVVCNAGDTIDIRVYHDAVGSVNLTYAHANLSVTAID